MSLSPFDSFQSRFVTYLLNFPRTITLQKLMLPVPSRRGMCKTSFNFSLKYLLKCGPVDQSV